MSAPPRCIVCSGPLSFWYADRGRDTFRCAACGHIQVPAGLARLADGRSIYEEAEAVFTSDGNADYYLDDTNAAAGRRKADYIQRFCGRTRLIDVGASYGHFLAALGDRFAAAGFEISPAAVAYARQHFAVEIMAGSVFDWPAALSAPAGAMTCWDVIEHLEDPRAAIRAMVDHLAPGGWLFLSTPDAGAAIARLMGRQWYYLDPVQHINVFSRRNLMRVLREIGLEVRDVRSIGRDYRVSYVFNHLAYLRRGRPGAALANLARRVTAPLGSRQIHLRFGDVMLIAAQKRSAD